MLNILSIDFEDWYHPELIQQHLKNKKNTPMVIDGIEKILDLLRKNETFATFFVVGELLEFKPDLLDKIIDNGHEIGFHTMHHTRLDSEGFKDRFIEEVKTFENLTDKKSKGFRAPTFSLNQKSAWLIDILEKSGYIYDSSIVPVKTGMYGMNNAEIKPYKITSKHLEKNNPDGIVLEFPLLVTKFLGKTIPAGGGFYLRMLPLKIIENAIKRYEDQDIPACLYIHSWELTPQFMPKVRLPFKNSFITYHNLEKAFPKMDQLIKKFRFTSFERVIKNSLSL